MKPLIPSLVVSAFMLASGLPSALAASFKEPVGLQLYSLRAEFTRNVPATLEKVAAYGIKDVELAGTYNLTPEKFKGDARREQAQAHQRHFPFARYKADPEGVAKGRQGVGSRVRRLRVD
jgi:hypothetical protein